MGTGDILDNGRVDGLGKPEIWTEINQLTSVILKFLSGVKGFLEEGFQGFPDEGRFSKTAHWNAANSGKDATGLSS